MTASLIKEIDELLDKDGPPITPASPKAAVGALQDLLRGHGHRKMPGVNGANYGKFGKATNAALLDFCKKHFPVPIIGNQVNSVTRPTLEALLSVQAINPIATQVYVTRKLDLEFTGYNRLSCLVGIGEGQGEFAALCLNTDKAGLSVGMIQWAQKPERLNELLKALPEVSLTAAFGSKAVADKVLSHTALRDESKGISGGVKKDNGKPEDPKLDFTLNDWPKMFRRLCLDIEVQKIQVTHAAKGFKTSKGLFDKPMPGPKSERLIAYLLDVVNQFGSAAPGFLKAAVDDGGLPTSLQERDKELIDRVTRIANNRLRAIGESRPRGRPIQKWSDAMILKVQKSRSDRAIFFKQWNGLSDEPFLD